MNSENLARYVAMAGEIVYFLRRDDRTIRIGTTEQFDVRIRALNARYGTLVLLAAEPGGHQRERELHRRFADLRLSPEREWFEAGPALLRHIDNLMTIGGYPITFEAPPPIPASLPLRGAGSPARRRSQKQTTRSPT